MVAGIEAEIFRPDDELRRLARCAVELGVDAQLPARDVTPRRSSTTLRAGAATPGRRGSRSWRPRAIPGSTSTSATASITITAPGTTTCRCRSRACPTTSSGCKAGESLERPIEQLQAERQQLIEDYRELLEHRRGARRLRSDDHAGAPRVPVRRGAQVLLRALVHEPVLQQDPRIRRAAGGARLLRRAPRTCSSSRTTSWSRRSST